VVLKRLKSGNENLLDLGCCFGQELRKLAADGAIQEKLYGSDLRAEFFEMGYRLFRDRNTLKSKFIAADITDPNSPLSELDGKIDIIYAGSFLHLFSYAGQIEVCKRLVKLLRVKKDSLVLGRQVGNVDAGDYVQKTNKGGNMYRHNAESFIKMWHEVGEATETKWRVDCKFKLLEWVSDKVFCFQRIAPQCITAYGRPKSQLL
jgi:SAM-dependent methyltransferase